MGIHSLSIAPRYAKILRLPPPSGPVNPPQVNCGFSNMRRGRLAVSEITSQIYSAAKPRSPVDSLGLDGNEQAAGALPDSGRGVFRQQQFLSGWQVELIIGLFLVSAEAHRAAISFSLRPRVFVSWSSTLWVVCSPGCGPLGSANCDPEDEKEPSSSTPKACLPSTCFSRALNAVRKLSTAGTRLLAQLANHFPQRRVGSLLESTP